MPGVPTLVERKVVAILLKEKGHVCTPGKESLDDIYPVPIPGWHGRRVLPINLQYGILRRPWVEIRFGGSDISSEYGEGL